jgi:hypothetical protein
MSDRRGRCDTFVFGGWFRCGGIHSCPLAGHLKPLTLAVHAPPHRDEPPNHINEED